MMVHTPTLLEALRLTFTPRSTPPRHVAATTGLLSVWAGLLAVIAASRALDRVLYPQFRAQQVRAPVYIVAAPRSGTTFLHRLLARDQRFVTIKLLHSLLPSISLQEAVERLAGIDEELADARLHGLVKRLEGWAFSGWRGIHHTALDEAEEDELLFVYTALSPALVLLFPFLDDLEHAAFVDDLPQPVQRRLMRWYLETLRRHLYRVGDGRTLLAKNALVAGRLFSMLEVMPDMRVIHIVRDPTESIPSALSMFTRPWKALAPSRAGATEQSRRLAGIIVRYYRRMAKLREELPPQQLVEVGFEELTGDPRATVSRIYDQLGLELTDEVRQALDEAAERSRNHKSRHRYDLEEFGLDAAWFRREAADVFQSYGLELP